MKEKIIVCILMLAVIMSTSVALGFTGTSAYTGETYEHNEKFSQCIVANGIDVSAWQGSVDWEKVKADGVDFAIIRVGGRGYGSSAKLYYDEYYIENIEKAKAAGLMIGVYFFSQAISEEEAIEEADRTLELLDTAKVTELDLPVFMDYEYAGDSNNSGRLNDANLSKAQMTAIAEAFCSRIENRSDYKAGIYANTLFMENAIDGKYLGEKGYFIWDAQYYVKCQLESSYEMWQYSSSGKVPGISGRVDCNFWYVDTQKIPSSDRSIAACQIKAENVVWHSDTNHMTQLEVKNEDEILTEGRDFRVGYINNRNTGTAYAVVMGTGEYTDYKVVSFEICEGENVKNYISSEKYAFGDFVTGIDLKTEYEDFAAEISVKEGYSFKVVDGSNSQVVSGYIGSGMKFTIWDDAGAVGEILIVARGDGNGDGDCDLKDLVRMRKQLLSIIRLDGAEYKALDINKSGAVDLTDLVVMRKHLLGIKEIKE